MVNFTDCQLQLVAYTYIITLVCTVIDYAALILDNLIYQE